MRRHLYSDDWEHVSVGIRARAQGQCECHGECGLHRRRRCVERHGEKAKWARGKVMLTVHHRNFRKTDNQDENLVAMCQRCHLRADRELRAARRIEKDKASGQGMLLDHGLDAEQLA